MFYTRTTITRKRERDRLNSSEVGIENCANVYLYFYISDIIINTQDYETYLYGGIFRIKKFNTHLDTIIFCSFFVLVNQSITV